MYTYMYMYLVLNVAVGITIALLCTAVFKGPVLFPQEVTVQILANFSYFTNLVCRGNTYPSVDWNLYTAGWCCALLCT